MPALTARSLAPLRRIDEASMTHTVVLQSLTTIHKGGGIYVQQWVDQPEQRGRLNPLALESPLRADQPSAARQWMLALKSGSTVTEGQRALVRGETNGQAWQRLVDVDEVVFPKANELRRRCLCSDVEVNP